MSNTAHEPNLAQSIVSPGPPAVLWEHHGGGVWPATEFGVPDSGGNLVPQKDFKALQGTVTPVENH